MPPAETAATSAIASLGAQRARGAPEVSRHLPQMAFQKISILALQAAPVEPRLAGRRIRDRSTIGGRFTGRGQIPNGPDYRQPCPADQGWFRGLPIAASAVLETACERWRSALDGEYATAAVYATGIRPSPKRSRVKSQPLTPAVPESYPTEKWTRTGLRSILQRVGLPVILPPPMDRTDVATTERQPKLLSWRQRCLAAAVAAGLAALLAVAVALKPSPLGLGTHQQLGLPPCSFQVLFGWPCPSCGMTTSSAHLVRGQLFGALRANVGGTLLGLIAVVAAPGWRFRPRGAGGGFGRPMSASRPGWPQESSLSP